MLLALLAGLGIAGWQYHRNHLGDTLVLAALDTQIGAQRIHFTKVALESVGGGEQERTYNFTAEGALAGDLFLRKDTEEILHSREPDPTAQLRTLTDELSGEDTLQLLKSGDLGTPPADPLQLVMLEKSASAGLAIKANGQLVATRGPGGWIIEARPKDFIPAIPLGKPRAHLPEQALLVTDPGFGKALDEAIAARLHFAAQLQVARDTAAERIRLERDARQTALLVALQPGTLFLGEATPLVEGTATSAPGLVLEITAVKPQTRQVGMVLRNQGDWSDARPFAGTWETDAEFTSFRIPVSTRANQAIPDAGPQLADPGTWNITLNLTPDGQLAGDSLRHHYAFTRVSSAELERKRSELSAAHNALLEATRVGVVYRGTITPKAGGEAVDGILRFVRQDNDGARIEAEVTLVDAPTRKRTFHGFAAANPHRTGRQPLRLTSETRRRQNRAPADSVVGIAADLETAFALSPTGLTGEDEYFVYAFASASAEAVERISAAHLSALAEIMAIVHPGSSYDGTARQSDGFSMPVRLRFTRADDNGQLEAVLESGDRPGVYAYLKGTLDTAERTAELANPHGRPDDNRGQRFPLFLRSGTGPLRLKLAATQITLETRNDPGWTLAFDLRSPAAESAAALPAWPSTPGVYLLVDNSWQALTRDRGRTTDSGKSKAPRSGEADDPTTPIKVGEVVFDGKNQTPTIERNSRAVIVHVGTISAPSEQEIQRYPEALPGYPGIELAPMRKALVGGKRTAELFRVTPAIAGFPTSRIAATLATPGEAITVLTTNAPIPSGFYALLANGEAYEIQVK